MPFSELNELHKVGLKATTPRMRILSIFEQHQSRHLSAEEIYKLLMDSSDEIPLATIYRVLIQFEVAGLVIRHKFEEGPAYYELDSGEHHDHIVCVDCGAIVEFVDAIIEKRQLEIAKQNQFKLENHVLLLHGRCQRKQCPNKKP